MDTSAIIGEMSVRSNELFNSGIDAVYDEAEAELGETLFTDMLPRWFQLSRKSTIQAIVEILDEQGLLSAD